ncbi:MAG: FitA-like ribbon-helix-helix domain-containing protein [Phycisphaerae bacterium]
MPDILVRGLDKETLERLKRRARRHGRSLQGEAKMLLQQAAGADSQKVAEILDRWDRRFKGRRFSGSVDMVRKDRER